MGVCSSPTPCEYCYRCLFRLARRLDLYGRATGIGGAGGRSRTAAGSSFANADLRGRSRGASGNGSPSIAWRSNRTTAVRSSGVRFSEGIRVVQIGGLPNMDKRRSKREPSGPATLGSSLQAHVRFIIACRGCGHRVEPDVSGLVERYGADTPVPDWAARLRSSR